ncbi:MAG: peptidoglycan D,D-transpeptidase FtsI family protein [Candidatus Margulisiibacteriota bacterium]
MSMNPLHSNTKRFIIYAIAFHGFIAILLGRLVYLQVVKYDFYKEKSEDQLKKVIRLYPHRGTIFDRNGVPLAITKASYSAFAIPTAIPNKAAFAAQVSELLGMSYDQVYRRIEPNLAFIWIKRKLDKDTYQKLKALNIEGLDFIEEEKRIYPNGPMAAQVLGFVGIDNQGLGGLEYACDSDLKGSPGKIILEGDPRGFRIVSGTREVDPSYDGKHVVTTLDSYTQYVTQKFLREGIEENLAESGQAIVMDCKTGDILAMASYPEFDPNHLADSTERARRNANVVDVYEPGSVFKIITLAGVLEEKIGRPDSAIYVPATLEIGTRTIHEAHAGSEGVRSIAEILKESLNVGTSLWAIKMGEKRFFPYILKFGFGQKTGIELPAESAGLVRHPEQWSVPDIAMISFGHGIAVTPLQIIAAGNVIANKGTWVKPKIIDHLTDNTHHLLRAPEKVERRDIISEKTAADMTQMMIGVVDKGTATSTKIPGFSIAGKTGTAQKVRRGGVGYEPGKYVASFLGFFPANNPRFIVLVVTDSPQKSIWGSTVACPIFKNIALSLIDHYDLKPDRPEEVLSLKN